MLKRTVGPFQVSALGLGCMNLSHAYGTPPAEAGAEKLLLQALELGINFFDTAALYGFGTNEKLVGRVLKPHRSNIVLASKGGMAGVDGKRVIDGSPQAIRRNCEDSLRNLQTEVIDLYYLHRWDKNVPIETSMETLAELVGEGKIKTIGLSEVSAATLRRAHAVHPVTAVQSEYSLWTRNPEIAMLQTCRELGVSFVPFSPLGRGFLGGLLHDPETQLEKGDIRLGMPRFLPEHFPKNFVLLSGLRELADAAGCSMAQLSLAWLLHKDESLVPIFGTTNPGHLKEDVAATEIKLDPAIMEKLQALINQHTVWGNRYGKATQGEIDSEKFNINNEM